MSEYVIVNGELYHHGVKGMKWGVRKKREYSGGIAGTIRRKQTRNAERDLADSQRQRRQVDSELRELRGYDKNPSKLGRSKISTAIRRNQIKSLEKTRLKLDATISDNEKVIKELADIGRAATKRHNEKIKVKEIKQKYRDQYMAGESAIGKIYAKLTDADKVYADMMYAINDRKR